MINIFVEPHICCCYWKRSNNCLAKRIKSSATSLEIKLGKSDKNIFKRIYCDLCDSTFNLITLIIKPNFNTNWLKASKGVFRTKLKIYGGLPIFSKGFLIDVQLGSKYGSDKDTKYAVKFKLTQFCFSIKTFYWQKEESTLILSNLPVFLFFSRSVGGSKFLAQVQRKRLQGKTFSLIFPGLMQLWTSITMIMRCV